MTHRIVSLNLIRLVSRRVVCCLFTTGSCARLASTCVRTAVFASLVLLLAASCSVDDAPTGILAPDAGGPALPLDDPPEPVAALDTVWMLADAASYETEVWEDVDISRDTTLTYTSTTWASPHNTFSLFIPALSCVSTGEQDDITLKVPTYASIDTAYFHVTFELYRTRASKTFSPAAEFTADFPSKLPVTGGGNHDYIAYCITKTTGTPITYDSTDEQLVTSSDSDSRAEIAIEIGHFSRWTVENKKD